MKALYDLSKKIAGFDFFPWLVMQKAHGCTEVVFNKQRMNTSKWPAEIVSRRFESILRPGPALLGLRYTFGKDGPQLAPYHQRDLIQLVRNGMVVPRLKSPLKPANVEYTVTLRRTQRAAGRNSREQDWRIFAEEIGAVVIPDYDDQPIHLHDRMALYAGAKMNFFVTNGPVMLCFLSEYPAMGFDVQNSTMEKFGVPFGEQYPFLLTDRHRQIYEPDTLENIRKHFYHWRDTGRFL